MILILVFLFTLWVLFKVFSAPEIEKIFAITLLLVFIPGDLFIFSFFKPIHLLTYPYIVYLLLNKQKIKILANIPQKTILIIYIVVTFIIALADARHSQIYSFNKAIYITATNIFMLLIAFIELEKLNCDEYVVFYKRFVLLVIPFGIYGVLVYLQKYNFYNAILANAFKFVDNANLYLKGANNRFQSSSFFNHPYVYSIFLFYVFVLLLVSGWSGFIKVKTSFLVLLFFITGINIFLTDSRLVLVIVLIASILFILFSSTFVKSLVRIVLGAFCFIILNQVPQINKVTSKITDLAANGGGRVEGSNLEMRQKQLLISLGYFVQSPIVGNGFGYIEQNLGFSSDENKRYSDKDALGFESYFFELLIEQGLIGIISTLVLFFFILIYHVKVFRNCENKFKSIVLANILILIGYFIFIMGTGVLTTMPLFFFLMGVSISLNSKLMLGNK